MRKGLLKDFVSLLIFDQVGYLKIKWTDIIFGI